MLREFESPGFVRLVMLVAVAAVALALFFGRFHDSALLDLRFLGTGG